MNTRGIFPSSKVIITLKVQTKDSQTQLPKAEYKYTAAKYEKNRSYNDLFTKIKNRRIYPDKG